MSLKLSMPLAIALAISAPAMAQNVDNTEGYEWVMSQKVPVTAGDITDRPYRIVGHITKGVHKATVFSKNPSQRKVYKELWEKARKMKADAVIFAEFGEARRGAFVHGNREARGVAIRFLKGAELEAWQAANPQT
ncbi:hypothetical protein [Altererythrobacter sp. ZODW24]|uniref:hypothetical protein n=1 Tax=Altererythrobacter sp. ZODW24 TaxID=2185142 RepID=UPI001F084308|nr:hypothetical protein [Altererythrobacter sp. ZODW24]